MNLLVNMRKPYGQSSKVHYSMTDVNASLTHLINKDSRISLNFYTGADRIANEWYTMNVKYWEGVRYTGNNGYDMDLSWGNILASLNWSRKFNDQLHLNTLLYYVNSNADVTIGHESWEMKTDQLLVTETSRVEDNHSKLHDLGAKADLDWIPSEYHHVNTGVSYVGHIFRPSRDFRMCTLRNGEALYDFDDSYSLGYEASEASVHASDEIAFFSWFKANVGLRYSYFRQGEYDNHSIEPRAALRFQLGQRTSLKMSYTEMSQAVHQVRANYIDLPMISWLPSTEKVAPMRARQVAAGVYLDLPHDITLNVEGYWKELNNIYEYSGVDNMYPDISIWEYNLAKGKGRSYGLETEFHWRTAKVDLAAYYTLSWSERFFDRVWHDWYPARNDNRHKLTVTSTMKFSDRFDMYAAWHYHTGDRSTVPTQILDSGVCYTSPYNHQMADYHRLDLGFKCRKTARRGNESIWNLSIYNAYCRMNPMFSMLDMSNEINEVSLVEIGVIPIIPSFNYTFRF
jgi:outer membrane receptor protein involved in Fe transport